ncbi:alpha-acetolactate decarboxylase [Streptococcus urinalis FB127-CNA-2]|uniref:Alpha-acetolactate decarboxylase n=1 Tax=Streptococcus urinalis 2285-97 TaxID=764291 RepID=G5KH06_9STRE|nr:acetolactate decarboxylase [Streptococcus urinalis]EHJ55633.1 alpha-acetolactate decarboxylase [Streptococcus urinalis 2285-97]EKS22446.1 alpha-acetolactate decarboxylase [Streptococcus urinalis FB127-CNA-2]VEF32259.1 alpha-acetolactate decarboxylase [Streptococcus urinalis]
MSNKTILYQHNTLAALMAGLYQGTMTINELLSHGDFGIGTLDSIDGELIVLDNKAYQCIGTGKEAEVIELKGDETIPYGAVLNHHADQKVAIEQSMTDIDLMRFLESHFSSANLFQSIKVSGQFEKMHIRMIPKSPLGKGFAEVASCQPEFTKESVSGTLVGFWAPELFHGVTVAGYHLHFLSDDHTFGGHVMDFVLTKGQAEIGQVDALEQDFPSDNDIFKATSFDVEALKEDINNVE